MLFGCAMRKSEPPKPRPRKARGIEKRGSWPGEATAWKGSIRRRSGTVLIAVAIALLIPAIAERLKNSSYTLCVWMRIAAAIVASDSTAEVGHPDQIRLRQREALQAAREEIQGEQ
jgi:hypothetical protein